jgi:ribose transport system permease protein
VIALPDAEAVYATSRRSRALDLLLRYGGLLVIVLVFAYFALLSPVFLTVDNMVAVLKQTAVLAVAAFGAATVMIGGGTHIIKGGIDLSVGAQLGLVTAIYALLLSNGVDPIIAIAVGAAAALLVGLVNGIAVAVIGIVPLLATLAMQNIVAGTELLITNNLNVPVMSPFIDWLSNGEILFMPVSVVILVVTFLGYSILIERTPLGVQIRATGGNRDAAIQSGIAVRRNTMLTYMLASLAVAIAAIIVVGRVSGSVRGIGPLMLLDILLAAYVSAMFSRRWVINIPGTLVGAIFVGVLTNGFTLVNIQTYWVLAVKGALILIVVAATSLQRQREAIR